MQKRYFTDDRTIEEIHRYSYYTDQYRKMNILQFNDNVQHDLQKLKIKAENYRHKSPCRIEIDTTIHRLKIFINFMGHDFRPINEKNYGILDFISDKSVRREIYKNSDKTPPIITNDITEDDELYALGVNCERHKSEKDRMDEANFTGKEKDRLGCLMLNSRFSNEDEVSDIAFDTVLSERENTK